jgi:hypothetical protein
VIWKKAVNQPLTQLKSQINHTLQLIKNALLVVTFLMSFAFIWQNIPVGDHNLSIQQVAEVN